MKVFQRNFKETQKWGLTYTWKCFILPNKFTRKQKKQSIYHLLSTLLHKQKGHFNAKKVENNLGVIFKSNVMINLLYYNPTGIARSPHPPPCE